MGSIAYQSIDRTQAARRAKRIVAGQVLETSKFRFPGSAAHAAQPDGQALWCVRLRVERLLKGAGIPDGTALRIFSPGEWFRHTHAALLQGGVVSYADPHYADGLAPDRIEAGMRLLVFLDDAPAPAGFPADSAFLAFGEAHEPSGREEDVVAALRDGDLVDFGRDVVVKPGAPVRFPDRLRIEFRGHSHKRAQVGGPRKEWIDLALSQEDRSGSLTLAHHIDADGSERWDGGTWGPYAIDAKAMALHEATLVVRKADPGAHSGL